MADNINKNINELTRLKGKLEDYLRLLDKMRQGKNLESSINQFNNLENSANTALNKIMGALKSYNVALKEVEEQIKKTGKASQELNTNLENARSFAGTVASGISKKLPTLYSTTRNVQIQTSKDEGIAEHNRMISDMKSRVDDANLSIYNLNQTLKSIDTSKLGEDLQQKVQTSKALLEQLASFIPKIQDISKTDFDFDFGNDSLDLVEEQLTTVESAVIQVASAYNDLVKSEQEAADQAALGAKAAEEAAKAEHKSIQDRLNAQKVYQDMNRNLIDQQLSMIKTVASAVNNAVNNILKAIKVVIGIIEKGSKLIIESFKKVGSIISGIIKLFGNLGNRVSSLFDRFKQGNASVSVFETLNKTINKLVGSVNKLYSGFNSVLNSEFIQNASKLTASIFSLNTITNNAADSSLKFADNLEKAFGIDSKSFVSDMGDFSGVLFGLGIASEQVGIASENLVAMSRFLASIGAAGGDVNVVTSKLVSGMRGMTAAIDDLGVSVREAEMNTFLKNLKEQGGQFANISTNFAGLNEQARVYVRYASIIDQVTSKYGNNMITMLNTATGETIQLNSYLAAIARSSDTVTGRINLMKQAMSSLTTVIGQGLLAAIANLSVFIIPLIKGIQALIIKIGQLINTALGWLGISIDMKAASENMLSGWSNVYKELDSKPIEKNSDAVDDLNKKLDDTSKSAKKASGGLQSFDRVNNLASKSSGGDSDGALGDDFDYSSLFNDALGNLRGLNEEASDDFYNQMSEKAKSILDEWKERWDKWIQEQTGRNNIDFGFDFEAIKENLNKAKDHIINLIKQWGTFFITIGVKFLDDINIGLIITKLTELLAKITEVADRISAVLIPALNKFYDIALTPIVTWFGEKIVEGIDWMIEELERWGKWFEDNKDLILTFFENLAKKVNAVWEIIKPFLDAGLEKLTELLSLFGIDLRNDMKEGMEGFNEDTDKWIEGLPGKFGEAIDTIKSFLDDVKAVFYALFKGEISEDQEDGTFKTILEGLAAINSIGQSAAVIIENIAKSFSNFVVNEALPWLVDKLQELGIWLDNHKADVIDFLNLIGKIAWESFKTFVDIVGQLIGYIIENPSAVTTFFATLVAIKIGSWAVGAAAGIGQLVMQINLLKSLGSITAALGGTGGAAGLGAIAASIAPIAVAVGAVVAVITTLIATSEEFRATLSSVFESISGAWNTLVEKLTGGDEGGGPLGQFKQAWIDLCDAIEPVVIILTSIAGGVIAGVLDAFGTVADFLLGTLSDALNVVTGLFDVLVGMFTGDPVKIQEGLTNIGAAIITFIARLPELLFGTITAIGTFLATTFEGIGTGLIDGFKCGIDTAWQNFVKFWSDIFDAFIQGVKDLFGIHSPSTLFKGFGDDIIQGLFNGIQETWNFVSGKIKEIWNNIIKGIKDAFGSIGDWFKDTFEKAKNMATGAFDGVVGKFTTIKDNIINVFKGIGDKVSGFFKPIKDTFDWVGNKVNDAKNWVGDKISGVVNKTSNTKATKITAHARGGSVPNGDLFIANEDGNPEFIGRIGGSSDTHVANNDMMENVLKNAVKAGFIEVFSMMKGGFGNQQQPIVINLNGDGFFSQSDLNSFANRIGPAIVAATKNNSNPNFSI